MAVYWDNRWTLANNLRCSERCRFVSGGGMSHSTPVSCASSHLNSLSLQSRFIMLVHKYILFLLSTIALTFSSSKNFLKTIYRRRYSHNKKCLEACNWHCQRLTCCMFSTSLKLNPWRCVSISGKGNSQKNSCQECKEAAVLMYYFFYQNFVHIKRNLVGWLFGFYDIPSLWVFLTPNQFYENSSISNNSV